MAKYEVQGSDLVIRLALNVRPTASSSGKSMVIDSTHGFVAYGTPFGDIKIGLNVITTDASYGARGQPAAKPVASVAAKVSGLPKV